MNPSLELRGQNVILRRPIIKDIDDRLNCGRNNENVLMYGGEIKSSVPFTMEDAIRWYELVVSNKYEWTIEFEGRCIGTARLAVNDQNRRATHAVDIFDLSTLGRELECEVAELVLNYAFNTLKLRKVDLKVLDHNKVAIQSYEKCGFIIEGTDREGVFVENRWESNVIMGIIEHEYNGRNNGDFQNAMQMS